MRPLIETERQVVDLVKCVERAQTAEVPSNSGVSLKSNLLPSASVVGSAADLSAVIGCIIANSMQAFESAAQAKIVRVKMAQDEDNVTVTITDNCPGMDDKTRHAAFAAFFSTKEGHRGLGLSVSLYVIRKHGGAIHLNSVSGKGTAVRVLLPLDKPTEP